jgi:hypothetical protein
MQTQEQGEVINGSERSMDGGWLDVALGLQGRFVIPNRIVTGKRMVQGIPILRRLCCQVGS